MGLENPSGAVREWSGLTWQEEEGRFGLGYEAIYAGPERFTLVLHPPSLPENGGNMDSPRDPSHVFALKEWLRF